MSDISGVLAEIEKEKKRPIPTPPVGFPIVWYLNGERDKPSAATVTDVEGPGRVAVAIQPKNSVSRHKTGVLYTHHGESENDDGTAKSTPHTARNGTWDYIPGFPKTIPAEHFEAHKKLLEYRETSALKQLDAEDTARKALEERRAKGKQPAAV